MRPTFRSPRPLDRTRWSASRSGPTRPPERALSVPGERPPMTGHSDKSISAPQTGFSGVMRKILERLPLPGDNRELMVVEVTYPPGGVAPLHRHPVGGAIYIVEGIAESAYGDDAPRTYKTGDTLQ